MAQFSQELAYPPVKAASMDRSAWRAGAVPDHTKLSSQVIVIHTLPLLIVFFALLLTMSFIVLILSVAAGFGLGNVLLRSNPVAAYEAVWPGQSVAAVAAYAQHLPQGYLSCVSGASPAQPISGLDVRVAPGAYGAMGPEIACTKSLDDGVFRWMTVIIRGEQVQALKLISDGLQQDSLLLYWGAPDALTKSGDQSQINLYWQRDTYSAMASIVEPDLEVQSLALTASASPT